MSGKEEDPQENLNYYSRERRLDKASPTVRAIYDPQGRRRAGGIFGSRTNIIMFATIFLIMLIYFLTSDLGGLGDAVVLGDNLINGALYQEGEAVILELRKDQIRGREAYRGPVELSVSPVRTHAQSIPESLSQRITFNEAPSELFRFTLPFEGESFLVNLRSPEEQISIRIP
ncbi:MAG: hypothetical protein FWH12_08975 [Treponema sp.]|nr:hypothetical protein [Treponema sp.]